MKKSMQCSFTLPLMLFASLASAQQPAVAPQSSIEQMLSRRVLVDSPVPGEVWATAGAWKAGFTAQGVEFVPFLGSDVPSRPVQFALQSAHVGRAAIELTHATPQQGARCVSYGRGGLREQYLLRQEGIEQQFVFESLPARGELVLDIAVQTALQHGMDGDAHAFTSPEGGVRYGVAVAIDARGRRCAMATTWTGDALRLTVPAGFVATAALPLLVDPLVGLFGSGPTATQVMSQSDMAYDYSSGQFYVCYERAYSATDHDVYVAVFDVQMNWQSTLTIDFTTTYWARPRIATLELQNLGCVVAETSAANAAPFVVRYRVFTGGATPTLQPVVQVPAGIGSDYLEPDIGGDSSPNTPGRFLIACSRRDTVNDSSILFYTLDASGVLSAGHTISSGVGLERRVAVSKTCGSIGGGSNVWALVYRHEVYQGTTGELHGTFVDRAGTFHDPVGPMAYFVLTPTTPNADSDWDVSSPTDDALGRRFACAEARVTSGQGAILGHVFDWNGNIAVGNATLLNSVFDRRQPRIDSDGCRFVLASQNVYPTDAQVRVTLFAQAGNAMDVQDVALPGALGFLDTFPGVVAMPGAGANAYGIAWLHGDFGSWSVQGQRYHGMSYGGLTTRTTGCGGLGIFAFGTPAIGESFGVSLTGVVGLTGFLAGTPVGNALPGCGNCLQGADGQILLGTQLNVAVPLQPSLVGAAFALQGLQLLAGPGPCLGQFELSNTIDITVQ